MTTTKENTKTIFLESWDSEGFMAFIIDNRRYTYKVDAARIPGYVLRFRRSPWKVLNDIKKTRF